MEDPITALKKACEAADGALEVAERAVQASKQALRERPSVTLVKVAASSCERLAALLHDTGVIQGTVEKIANQLQQADKPLLLNFLEKLASKAIFIPSNQRVGVLVPKPERRTINTTDLDAVYTAAAAAVDGR